MANNVGRRKQGRPSRQCDRGEGGEDIRTTINQRVSGMFPFSFLLSPCSSPRFSFCNMFALFLSRSLGWKFFNSARKLKNFAESARQTTRESTERNKQKSKISLRKTIADLKKENEVNVRNTHERAPIPGPFHKDDRGGHTIHKKVQ